LLISAAVGASCSIGGQLAVRRWKDNRLVARCRALSKEVESLTKQVEMVSWVNGRNRKELASFIRKTETLAKDVQAVSKGNAAHVDAQAQAREIIDALQLQQQRLSERVDSAADGLGRHEEQLAKLSEQVLPAQNRLAELTALQDQVNTSIVNLSGQLQGLGVYVNSRLEEVGQARQQLENTNSVDGITEMAALQRAAQAEFARRQRAEAEALFQVPAGGGQ
jgi:chromosome segregation ATPase